jgi:hypothetical protein
MLDALWAHPGLPKKLAREVVAAIGIEDVRIGSTGRVERELVRGHDGRRCW